MRARAIASVTACVLAAHLVTLPCGAACHPSDRQHSPSNAEPAEHSCHEPPATEDVRQVAASPASCTHDHDGGETALAPVASPRDDHRAATPVMPASDQIQHIGTDSFALATPSDARDPIASTFRFPSPLRI